MTSINQGTPFYDYNSQNSSLAVIFYKGDINENRYYRSRSGG